MTASLKTIGAFFTLAVMLSCAAAADLGAPLPSSPLPDAAPFFVKLGAAGLRLSEKADIFLAGAPLAGANIKVKSQYTATVEVGYYVTPNWAVAFTGGLPPLAKVDAAGSIAPYGRLADVRYGPVALTAQYHFTYGALRPYIGAGPAVMLVVGNHDRVLTNFKMRDAAGFAGQVGADVMVTERFGLFVDAKKVYLRTSAVGSFGPAPAKAKVMLDPLILSTGVVARF